MGSGEDVVARWKAVAKTRDPAALHKMLAETVTFRSPVVHTPQVGRAITAKYLGAAIDVLFTDTFRYVAEWRAERSAVLEFEVEIEGVSIDGVDILTWDEAGLITEFKVMARPLKAIHLLHRLMGERLAR